MNSTTEYPGANLNNTPHETKSTEQTDSNQNASQNTEANNQTPKGTSMQDEQNYITEQTGNNQDASQIPETNNPKQEDPTESTNVSSSHLPSSKDVAILKNAIDKKRQKSSRLAHEIAEAEATLDRGYTKEVTNAKKKTVRFVYLTDSDKQFLEHKIRQLKIEEFGVNSELKELKKHFKELTSKSINGNKKKLSSMQEDSKVKNLRNNAVDKLKKTVTKENINNYPSLSDFSDGQPDSWIELENFFSTNLTTMYTKFQNNPQLKESILKRSATYIKNLSK